MEEMVTPQKIWACGNALAISIPKKIAELKGYEKGKMVMIGWGEVVGEAPIRKVKKKESVEEENRLPSLE